MRMVRSALFALFFASLVPAQSIEEEILAQERAGLEALKNGNVQAFADAIAEEAVFVDSSGPAGKAQVVKNVAGFHPHDFTISDVRFVGLSKDSGLIVYVLDESGTTHGRDFSAKVNVSAIWTKRSGKWQCLFSQETSARK